METNILRCSHQECNNQCGLLNKVTWTQDIIMHLFIRINLFHSIKLTFNPTRILEVSAQPTIKEWVWWARIRAAIIICNHNKLVKESFLFPLQRILLQSYLNRNHQVILLRLEWPMLTQFLQIQEVKSLQQIKIILALIKTLQKSHNPLA